MSVRKLLERFDEKQKDIDFRVENFGKVLDRVQGEIWSDLQDHLRRYDLLKSDKARRLMLKDTRANINLAMRSFEDIRGMLQDRGYFQEANRFVGSYAELKKTLGQAFSEVKLPLDFTHKNVAALEALITGDLQVFRTIGDDVARRVHRTIFESVLTKRSIRDLQASLEDVMVGRTKPDGTPLTQGEIRRAAGSWAETSMKGFDRQVTAMAAENAGLDRFAYMGPADEVTRQFCFFHVGLVLTREQIDKLDNGQIGPVMQYGGGHRCRHSWVPVPSLPNPDVDASTLPQRMAVEEIAMGKRKMKVYRVDKDRPLLSDVQQRKMAQARGEGTTGRAVEYKPDFDRAAVRVAETPDVGYVVMDDGDDFENMSLKFDQTNWYVDGQPRTVGRMHVKLREDADARFVESLHQAAEEAPNPAEYARLKLLKMVEEHDKMVAAGGKNINAHFKQANKEFEDTWGRVLYEQSGVFRDNVDKVLFYLRRYDDMQIMPQVPNLLLKNAGTIKGSRKLNDTITSMGRTFTVSRREVVEDVSDGIMGKRGRVFQGRKQPRGSMDAYEYVLEDATDGTKIFYKPWDKDNFFSSWGQFRVEMAGEMTAARMQEMNSLVRGFGLGGTATAEQVEYLYLAKNAWLMRWTELAQWKKIEAVADPKERLLAARKLVSEKMGVADVTKLRGYNPAPVWDEASGKFTQGNFVTEKFLAQLPETKEWVLSHNLTYKGGTFENELEKLLDAGMTRPALVSVEERRRLGMVTRGYDDQQSGGANQVFFRLQGLEKGRVRPGCELEFDTQLLRQRDDFFAYSTDSWGTTIPEKFRNVGGNVKPRGGYERRLTPDEFYDGKVSAVDEIMFRDSVPLDYLVRVNLKTGVYDEGEAVAELFRKAGLGTIRGKKIEDIIHMRDGRTLSQYKALGGDKARDLVKVRFLGQEQAFSGAPEKVLKAVGELVEKYQKVWDSVGPSSDADQIAKAFYSTNSEIVKTGVSPKEEVFLQNALTKKLMDMTETMDATPLGILMELKQIAGPSNCDALANRILNTGDQLASSNVYAKWVDAIKSL